MKPDAKPILVLDAHGVIYHHADDVDDLLVPFVAEKGGSTDIALINARYLEASLGRITADAFWDSVGLNAAVEDEYLARHQLAEGLIDFLRKAQREFAALACLTNDVGAWSRKLRKRHGLTGAIPTWVVGADVGLRKPTPEIYQVLLRRLETPADRVVFVDDRVRNLDAARSFGIQTVWLSAKAYAAGPHAAAGSLAEVWKALEGRGTGER